MFFHVAFLVTSVAPVAEFHLLKARFFPGKRRGYLFQKNHDNNPVASSPPKADAVPRGSAILSSSPRFSIAVIRGLYESGSVPHSDTTISTAPTASHQQQVVGGSSLQMPSGVHASTSLSSFSNHSTASGPGSALPRTSSQTCSAGLSNIHIALVNFFSRRTSRHSFVVSEESDHLAFKASCTGGTSVHVWSTPVASRQALTRKIQLRNPALRNYGIALTAASVLVQSITYWEFR